MSTKRNPVVEGVELDWRWVGELESWMGLRSERAVSRRRRDREELARLNSAASVSESAPNRFAVGLALAAAIFFLTAAPTFASEGMISSSPVRFLIPSELACIPVLP